MSTLSYPNPPDGNDDFLSGSKISSDEVDGNFDAIKNHLNSDFVDTANIADGAVTNDKLALDSVEADNIVDGEVGTAELADLAVTNAKLDANSVTTDKILDGTIVGADIADATISAAKLDFTITPGILPPNSVGSVELVDGSVEQVDMANNSIGTMQLIDGNVTLAKLAPDSVDASKIVDGSVGSDELATDSVGADEIQAGAVGNAEIASNAVGSAEIAALAVTGAKLAAGAVTATKMGVFPRAKVNRNNPQTINVGSTEDIVCAAADTYDTNNMHDPAGANPERVYATVDGFFCMSGRINWEIDPGTDQRGVQIWHSSLGVIGQLTYGNTPGFNNRQQVVAQAPMAAGDYVTLRAFHGEAYNVDVNDGQLEICMVSA